MTNVLVDIQHLLRLKTDKQNDAVRVLLARFGKEAPKLFALKQCLKAFNIPFDGNADIPFLALQGNQHNVYQKHFNRDMYLKALGICKLAYQFEQNGIPEEQATKLAVIFDDSNALVDYLTEHCKSANASNTPLHDACLFSLPDFHAKGFHDKNEGCKFEIFKKMAAQNRAMMRKDFKELLPFAWELQKLVVSKAKAASHKPDNALIKNQSELISQTIKRYNELEAKKGVFDAETENEYHLLAKTLSEQLRELAKLSAGKYLKDLTLIELKAFYEEFKCHAEKGYNTFIEHGIPAKYYAEFKTLVRQDNDRHIPKVSIDSKDLGRSGFYLMKVPVLNEEYAAKAACLGKMTSCCQSLSGESGHACTIHGLTSPYGGFYVLCQGDSKNPQITDTVVAQSWAWRSQSGAIVLDSIEVNHEWLQQAPANKDLVMGIYHKFAQTLVKQNHTSQVLCGTSPALQNGIGKKPLFPIQAKFKDYEGYCDSDQPRILYDAQKPYYYYSEHPEYKLATDLMIEKAAINGVSNEFKEFLLWAFTQEPNMIEKAKFIFKKLKKEQVIENLIAQFKSKDSLKTLLNEVFPTVNASFIQNNLHYYVQNGEMGLLKLACILYQDEIQPIDLRNALSEVAYRGDLDTLKFMLEACQLPSMEHYIKVAFSSAVWSKKTNVVAYLIENYTDSISKQTKFEALKSAAKDPQLCTLLLNSFGKELRYIDLLVALGKKRADDFCKSRNQVTKPANTTLQTTPYRQLKRTAPHSSHRPLPPLPKPKITLH